jgi:hypothetical protein
MSRATIEQLVHGARVVATIVGAEQGVYCFGGRIAVPVGGNWSLVLSADYAERLRIEACFGQFVVATMWAFAGDDDRLAELASAARAESAALAA